MKKFIRKPTIIIASAVAVIALVIVLTVSGVFGGNSAVLSLSTIAAKPGEEVTLDLNLSKNPGVVCIEARIEYDTAALELVSTESTDEIFPADTLTCSRNFTDIPYRLTWEDGLNPDHKENGTLGRLTFKIKDTAPKQKYTVALSVKDFFDFNFNDKNVETKEGIIAAD